MTCTVASIAVPFVIASCADDPRPSLAPDDAGGEAHDAADSAGGEPSGDADASSVDDADGGSCSKGGYCWSELPPDTSLRGVWSDGAGMVWAVSNEGNILSLDGSKWVVRHTGTMPLLAIWGSSPTDIWVGGGVVKPTIAFDEEGVVLDGVDAVLLHGQGADPSSIVWTEIVGLPGEAIAIRSIWGSGADDIWAVGAWGAEFRAEVLSFLFPPQSRILHYRRTAGATEPSWTLDPLSSISFDVTKIWGDENGEPWLTGIERYVEYSPDRPEPEAPALLRHVPQGGNIAEGWDQVPIKLRDPQSDPIVGLSSGASSGREVWLVGQAQGSTLHPSVLRGLPDMTGALVWEESRRGGPGPRDILMASANQGWLLPIDDSFVQQWDGARWSAARIGTTNLPLGRRFWGIWGTSPDDVWIVGDNLAVHTGPIPTEAK